MDKQVALVALLALLGSSNPFASLSANSSSPGTAQKQQRPVGTPASKPQNTPSSAPVPLSKEEAFYYFLAVYGLPADVVDRYGRFFDTENYAKSIADEFSRQRYREKLRARIEAAVSKVDFNKRFVAIGQGELGEYAFDGHSFPFKRLPKFGYCLNSDHSSGVCYGSLMDVDIFTRENVINTSRIQWVLPMSPDLAAEFVRGRQTGRGSVDRLVTVKVIYSIVNKRATVKEDLRDATFYPMVHSIEVFADEALAKRLGKLTISSSKYPTAAEWSAAIRQSETPSREIGRYPYTAYVVGYMRGPGTPVTGTIALTDVDITLSGEREGKSAQPWHLTLYEALVRSENAEKPHDTRAIRANYVNNTWGNKSFRVVWSAVDQDDYDSPFVFATLAERDRFFSDLTSAIRAWSEQYSELGMGSFNVDDRCMVRGAVVPCSESHPFQVKSSESTPRSSESEVAPNQLRERTNTAIADAKQKIQAAQHRRATVSPQYAQAVSMYTEALTLNAGARTNDDLNAIIIVAKKAGELADQAMAAADLRSGDHRP